MKLALFTETFENHSLTTLKDDSGEVWFLGRDLAAPLAVGRDAVRHQIADLEPSDKAVIQIHTPGGPQKMTFVSESGALQIIVQSRKPEARRLRKWVCDLAVRYAKGELTEASNYVTRDELNAALSPLIEAMRQLAGVVQVLADSRPALKPVRLGGRSIQDLTLWTVAEHKRQRARGYITAAEVLAFKLGRKATAIEAGSLTNRTKAYCRAHSLKPHVFYYQGHPRLYLPQTAAELVLRTGWTAKNQVFAEAQGDLFKKLGESK